MTTDAEPQVNVPAGFKDLSQDDIRTLVQRSVIETETAPATGQQPGGGISTIFMLATAADRIPKWGTNPYIRDVRLRQFFGQEAFSTSAISTLIARNMGFGWRMKGENDNQARDDADTSGSGDGGLMEYCRKTLTNSSDHLRGWQHFVSTLSLDLYTQDRSAIYEIVREVDNPAGRWIGLNHLDSLRCWHTGDPFFPVAYLNKNGKWQKLPWYRVQVLSELPATHETAYGLQYSALTRILAVAQVFRNTLQLMSEKTSGDFTKAIHVISGVTSKEVEDAIKMRQLTAEQEGQMRGLIPAILSTLNPDSDPKMITLELASLPEQWKLDEIWKWFTVVVAMGLWSDYGDFAPLPGNNLGTAAQSETMYERSKGKGAAVFRELVDHSLNTFVMPEGVTFEWWVSDPGQDAQEASNTKARADARSAMIANGEIDAVASRKMALQAGDITQEVFDEMEARQVEIDAAEEQERQEQMELQRLALTNERPASPPRQQPGQKARTSLPVEDNLADRQAYEAEVAAKIAPALEKAGNQVKRKLRQLK